jgi:hypothetical protein
VRLKSKLVGTASAVLVATSVLAIGATAAYAGKPTVVPGPGDTVSCHLTAKAKLSPPLKNDWDPADHSSDPDAVVAALPYTTEAAASAVTTSAKGKGDTCTGTVAGFAMTSLKLVSSSTSGTPPLHATCAGLASPGAGTTFQTILSYKLSGAVMADSTVTSDLASLIDGHGVGFALAAGPGHPGTVINGSFAGGSSNVHAYVDGTTFGILANSTKASSTAPTAPDVCEPGLKIKKAGTPGETATIKAPKGFKKLSIGPGAFDASPSTITISGT